MSTRLILLKFGDMVEMYVKFCMRVAKFKMLDSKTGLRALLTQNCQNGLCLDYFSLTTHGIVLKFKSQPKHMLWVLKRTVSFLSTQNIW